MYLVKTLRSYCLYFAYLENYHCFKLHVALNEANNTVKDKQNPRKSTEKCHLEIFIQVSDYYSATQRI